MRISDLFLPTLKENPADAQTISHQLMLRAGMIRQVGSGLYHWLPLGYRVLCKVRNIVQQEMQAAGYQEMLMSAVQPADIWQASDRWDSFGPELLKFQDRHGRDSCIAPTHEEAITTIMKNDLKSYKQTPLKIYQIQTKFRDEIRPRAGVMRSREFLMKDAYSFHTTVECLDQTYQQMYTAYTTVFKRLGLVFRSALADTGSIGGAVSHEFHVIADSGEDKIAISNESDYAANIELAEAICLQQRPTATNALEKIDTPDKRTIKDLCDFLGTDQNTSLKAIIVKGAESPVVALFLRGDHELNELKAEKHPAIAAPLEMATPEAIEQAFGCPHGYLGPVGATIPVIADRSASVLADFSCGANEAGKHYINANWGRDCAEPEVFDLRLVVEGDPSPDGKGTLTFTRGIEVGHIFQLGNKYSKSMNASVLAETGKAVHVEMGCYGIGVSRIVAASIEQNHDDRGIIWPENIAPFQVAIAPINLQKSERLKTTAEALYQELTEKGFDVLFYDKKERPGVMFSELELIGIPHRIVLSDKLLDDDHYEYFYRPMGEKQIVDKNTLIELLPSIRYLD